MNTDDAQVPRNPTNVAGPTAAEIELRNATHLPYRSLCRWCVMSGTPTPTTVRPAEADRDVPRVVCDYAFIRSWGDNDVLTTYVGRLYPTTEIIVIPCEQKGNDEYAVSRLADSILNSGVKSCTWLTRSLPWTS